MNYFSTCCLPQLWSHPSFFITINSWVLDLDFKNPAHRLSPSIHFALSNFHILKDLQLIAPKTFTFLTICYTCGPSPFSSSTAGYMVHTSNYPLPSLLYLSGRSSILVKMQLSTSFLLLYLWHPENIQATSRSSVNIWWLKNDGRLMGGIMQLCKIYLESFISSRMFRITWDDMGETR